MNPRFTMKQLVEAGLYFGHRTRSWNPKMAPYIYGVKNGIHIINLEKTAPMLQAALDEIKRVISRGGRILFVGTKKQASEIVKEAVERCGQYYINHRWLGGLLTNWKTITESLKRLRGMEELLEKKEGLTKKELLKLEKKHQKLNLAIGGIRNMGNVPDIVFVIDTNKESIAVEEAKKLGIPIVAVLDTNSSPDGILYKIPGNDDAIRSIKLYCDLVADAVLEGLQDELASSGLDVGSSEDLPFNKPKKKKR